ncbi:MAG: PD-(D/E)XK nuclease family transposase [Bacteroidota bacterium]
MAISLLPPATYDLSKCFGTLSGKPFLIDFLHQVLPEKHHIKELQFVRDGRHPQEKRNLLECRCESYNGIDFLVHVRRSGAQFSKGQSLSAALSLLHKQSYYRRGQRPQLYQIELLDVLLDQEKPWGNPLCLVEWKDQKGQDFFEGLKLSYIELPKFRKSSNELRSRRDKWLFLLKHLPRLHRLPETLQDDTFEKFFDSMKNKKTTSKLGPKSNRKLSFAKELKRNGESISTIMKFTKLSEDDIDKL